jgi:hypothetical protein
MIDEMEAGIESTWGPEKVMKLVVLKSEALEGAEEGGGYIPALVKRDLGETVDVIPGPIYRREIRWGAIEEVKLNTISIEHPEPFNVAKSNIVEVDWFEFQFTGMEVYWLLRYRQQLIMPIRTFDTTNLMTVNWGWSHEADALDKVIRLWEVKPEMAIKDRPNFEKLYRGLAKLPPMKYDDPDTGYPEGVVNLDFPNVTVIEAAIEGFFSRYATMDSKLIDNFDALRYAEPGTFLTTLMEP